MNRKQIIFDELKNGIPDAYSAHTFKQALDGAVTFGKTASGQAGQAENVIKGLRTDIDNYLDLRYLDYDAANAKYKATREAIDEFGKAVGKSLNIMGETVSADEAIGTALRRVMSNAQSRTLQVDALEKLQDVANTYGGNFVGDLEDQIIFANFLEQTFGTFAPTGFTGQAALAGSQVIQGNVVGAGATTVKAMIGLRQTRAKQIEALSNLLKGSN